MAKTLTLNDVRIEGPHHKIWIDGRDEVVRFSGKVRSFQTPFAEILQVELFVAPTGLRKVLRFLKDRALDLGDAVSKTQALLEARELAQLLTRPLRLFEKDHREAYFCDARPVLSAYGQPRLHDAPPSRGLVRLQEVFVDDDPTEEFSIDVSDLSLP